jgi:hypothetical protein
MTCTGTVALEYKLGSAQHHVWVTVLTTPVDVLRLLHSDNSLAILWEPARKDSNGVNVPSRRRGHPQASLSSLVSTSWETGWAGL